MLAVHSFIKGYFFVNIFFESYLWLVTYISQGNYNGLWRYNNSGF
jgi:hypothetical protein